MADQPLRGGWRRCPSDGRCPLRPTASGERRGASAHRHPSPGPRGRGREGARRVGEAPPGDCRRGEEGGARCRGCTVRVRAGREGGGGARARARTGNILDPHEARGSLPDGEAAWASVSQSQASGPADEHPWNHAPIWTTGAPPTREDRAAMPRDSRACRRLHCVSAGGRQGPHALCPCPASAWESVGERRRASERMPSLDVRLALCQAPSCLPRSTWLPRVSRPGVAGGRGCAGACTYAASSASPTLADRDTFGRLGAPIAHHPSPRRPSPIALGARRRGAPKRAMCLANQHPMLGVRLTPTTSTSPRAPG